MALNWPTFRTRALTAIVFVAVMLVGLLWNLWSFLVLVSIIHFGCWFEYQRLISKIHPAFLTINAVHRYAFMMAGWLFLLSLIRNDQSLFGLPLQQFFSLGALTLIITGSLSALIIGKPGMKNLAWSLLGLLYISLSLALMTRLWTTYYNHPYADETGKTGINIALLIILSIWINDTMAYIVGSFIGRTPLSKISPKKTWEGTIGGIILSVAAISFFLKTLMDWRLLLAISFIASVTGSVGDLLESKLKRMAAVKDSGNMMPGHGGFLDRFDSLLLAVPFVWLYLQR